MSQGEFPPIAARFDDAVHTQPLKTCKLIALTLEGSDLYRRKPSIRFDLVCLESDSGLSNEKFH